MKDLEDAHEAKIVDRSPTESEDEEDDEDPEIKGDDLIVSWLFFAFLIFKVRFSDFLFCFSLV